MEFSDKELLVIAAANRKIKAATLFRLLLIIVILCAIVLIFTGVVILSKSNDLFRIDGRFTGIGSTAILFWAKVRRVIKNTGTQSECAAFNNITRSINGFFGLFLLLCVFLGCFVEIFSLVNFVEIFSLVNFVQFFRGKETILEKIAKKKNIQNK